MSGWGWTRSPVLGWIGSLVWGRVSGWIRGRAWGRVCGWTGGQTSGRTWDQIEGRVWCRTWSQEDTVSLSRKLLSNQISWYLQEKLNAQAWKFLCLNAFPFDRYPLNSLKLHMNFYLFFMWLKSIEQGKYIMSKTVKHWTQSGHQNSVRYREVHRRSSQIVLFCFKKLL